MFSKHYRKRVTYGSEVIAGFLQNNKKKVKKTFFFKVVFESHRKLTYGFGIQAERIPIK